MIPKVILTLLLLSLLLALPFTAEAQKFISPKYKDSGIPGPYGGDEVWTLGSSQIVAFQTNWYEYKIELWQQSVGGSLARVSSNLVYTQSSGGDLPQSFFWTVQTYELQLSDSPVFFFWLRDGNSDAQQTSAYFNITTVALSSSPSSSTAASTSIRRPTESTQTRTSSPARTAVPTQLPPVLPNSSGSTPTAAPSQLSPGAAAGVGVGVAAFVILAAAFAASSTSRGKEDRGGQWNHRRLNQ